MIETFAQSMEYKYKNEGCVMEGTENIFGRIFKIRLLSKDQKLEFEKEQQFRIRLRMKFVSLVIFIVVVLFALIDYVNISDSEMIYKLNMLRAGFVLLFLLPFSIFFYKFRRVIHQYVLFYYALGCGIYLFALSSVTQENLTAVFHNTVGVFMLNVCIFLLFGLKKHRATIISVLLFLLVHLNYTKVVGFVDLPISRFDFSVWYIIVSVVSYFFGLQLENAQIASFVSRHELKEANNSRYKLFSIVSHDLKNIISAQTTITDFLYNTRNKNTEDSIKMLALLYKSSNDALSLFDDLMTWIKLQMEAIKPAYRVIDCNQFIEDQLGHFEIIAESKKITFNKSAVDLKTIQSDATILSLVFRNIIGNAIKFSNENTEISIAASEKPNGYQFQIKDSGKGMSEQFIQNLFKNNSSVSTSGTAGEKGSGMGLILSKELLVHINGNINIESEKDVGTSVYINLNNLHKRLN